MSHDEIEQKVVAALLHAQGCANSFKMFFQNREISSVSIETLIDTILDSFSLALSLMATPNPPPHHESSSQNMAGLVVPRRSLKKKTCGLNGTEYYKDHSPNPLLADGFSWRKYGQKTIKNTPHQRCYYRCTHAKDQNCNAMKRVQKIQDSPPVYRSIYVGHHTCNTREFTNSHDAYGSKMIQFDKYDHVMPEPVMPQLAPVNHPEIPMEDKAAANGGQNQECDVNDFLVDDDELLAYQFPPFSPGDFMFLENFPAFDDYNPFQV